MISTHGIYQGRSSYVKQTVNFPRSVAEVDRPAAGTKLSAASSRDQKTSNFESSANSSYAHGTGIDIDPKRLDLKMGWTNGQVGRAALEILNLCNGLTRQNEPSLPAQDVQ